MDKNEGLCQIFMKKVLLLVLFSGIGFSADDGSLAECLSYEPATVSLTGRISKKTFAGRPNYESIEKGDEPVTYWVLRLAKPACVSSGSRDDDPINVTERDVSDVQLVLTSTQYSRFKKMIGGRVAVKGKLFHAHTGHHFTTVLLTVEDMKAARR